MPVDSQYTPLPPVRNAPIRVELPVWDDLSANDRVDLINTTLDQSQAVDIEYVGARPEADVDVQIEAGQQTTQGATTDRETVTPAALPAYDVPAEGGPTAVTDLRVTARNRSATAFTQASAQDPYQAYLNYTIRSLSVFDKIKYGIPLTDPEDQLRQSLNLEKYRRMNLVPEQDPFYAPDLRGKSVLDDATTTDVVDVDATGAQNAVPVVDLEPAADEVVYIQGVGVNSEDYALADNLTLAFERPTNDDYYRLPTWPMPGGDYMADLHLPVLDRTTISAFASNAVAGVELRVKYATVQRSLLEKALYGLDGEVRANDAIADSRFAAYERFRDLIRAGLPLTPNIDATLEQSGALQALEETEWMYGQV